MFATYKNADKDEQVKLWVLTVSCLASWAAGGHDVNNQENSRDEVHDPSNFTHDEGHQAEKSASLVVPVKNGLRTSAIFLLVTLYLVCGIESKDGSIIKSILTS